MPATRPGDVGSEIEDRAVAWWGLHRPGSRLLARNYRRRGGEIDLIFEELRRPVGGDASRVELVFVEVRARRGADAWVSGAESVDYRKRLRLERTARDFLWRYRGGAQAVRFDVLDWDGNGFTHLEAAWSPRA